MHGDPMFASQGAAIVPLKLAMAATASNSRAFTPRPRVDAIRNRLYEIEQLAERIKEDLRHPDHTNAYFACHHAIEAARSTLNEVLKIRENEEERGLR